MSRRLAFVPPVAFSLADDVNPSGRLLTTGRLRRPGLPYTPTDTPEVAP